MLKLVRKFIKNHSPDWLNTEVNKDLLQNLSANITSTPKTQDINSALIFKDLNLPQDEVKRSQTKSDTSNDRLLMTVKGTPHWRRINQVFQSLDNAPENATYSQLSWMRITTPREKLDQLGQSSPDIGLSR